MLARIILSVVKYFTLFAFLIAGSTSLLAGRLTTQSHQRALCCFDESCLSIPVSSDASVVVATVGARVACGAAPSVAALRRPGVVHGSAVAVFAAILVLGLVVVARLMVVRSRGNIAVLALSTGSIIAAGLAPVPIAAQACVKPAKVSHELHVCHVAQL